MALSEDLSAQALGEALGERPFRAYPALLSTESDARAWARAGGPAGALVVADYQAAARGRGGLPWETRPGRDLCFTLVLRPRFGPDHEGWLYVAAAIAVLDVIGGDVAVEWPDRVLRDGERVADVAGHAGLEAGGVGWAVINVLLLDVAAPRGSVMARLAEAVEQVQEPDPATLARYNERCATLGRRVVAHVIPTWPDGVQIAGTATRVLPDGALAIEGAETGRTTAVRPQHLARLERA